MKFNKNSKIVYILLALFYTTFVALITSLVTVNIFLNNYFNSQNFQSEYKREEYNAMYIKYLEELNLKLNKKFIREAKSRDEFFEAYRKSVIEKLNLIESNERKRYILKDMLYDLESEKEKLQEK